MPNDIVSKRINHRGCDISCRLLRNNITSQSERLLKAFLFCFVLFVVVLKIAGLTYLTAMSVCTNTKPAMMGETVRPVQSQFVENG